MQELEEQLNELNNMAARLYDYFEQHNVRITRRRLLLMQALLYIDTNASAIFTLLKNDPPYLDSAEMIMRSIYDLALNVDWVRNSRTNVRLWRWLRDDRKTLHRQMEALVALRTANPRLNTKKDPLITWTKALAKTEKELISASKNAKVTTTEKEVSLFAKVKTFSIKSQQVYHTVFWLFSTKTHASASGLQELITLNPLHLKRRTEPVSAADSNHATMLARTCLLWYSAQIYRDAQYLKAPFVDEAKALYEAQLTR